MRRAIAAVLLAASSAAMAADDLASGFADPPAAARPRTWWHWLNGNITVAGLDADLAWMKRAGLGGVQAFDASLGTPQLVARPIAYMTAEWKAAFDHAAATADRLGLELAIASSPGWSETGGPWVPAVDGMKKLVWSSTEVTGGRRRAAPLPAPPAVTGPYGTAPFSDPLIAAGGAPQTPAGVASGPVASFAYPIPGEADVPAGATATVEAGGALDVAALTDGREDSAVAVPRAAGRTATVVLRWPRRQTIRSATIFVPSAVMPFGGAAFAPVLEARVGQGWQAVAALPLANVPTTVAFAPVTADAFRVRFADAPAARSELTPSAPGAEMPSVFATAAPDQPIALATLELTGEQRIDRFEAKAGFVAVPDYYALSQGVPAANGIDPARVIDLTDRVRADGTLDWTPPRGRWRIVRMGWSLIGTTNHPAAPASTGLEVDKYDGAAVRRYIDHYLGTYRDGIASGHVKALLTDSIEAGDANWTPGLLDRFARLRGYDPRPWLPALTGAVVGSRERSDAFLYDWRRTLADLLASQHYGTIAHAAHAAGLKVYGEALENGRPQLGDDLAMRAQADVPMAAMWAFARDGAPRPTLIGDILGAASVAHFTGRNLVAAESFTSIFAPWAAAPADLKHVADLEFALGVNRPVIHTSPSSPMDDKLPGLSLAVFGQYFNRRETWAEMAHPWIDYLARTGFLMQQGRHVADIAYFIGEEAPVTALYAERPLADAPTTRGFDFVNAAFLAALRVDRGTIVSPGGARYRLLYLGGSSARMTLATLRALAALVEAGAVVVGPAPVATPSLSDDPRAFAALVARLWPGGAVATVGAGRVHAGRDVAAAFDALGLPPDLVADGAPALLFQHRATADADIYLVHNPAGTPVAGEVRFRVAGRAPELWDADTGTHRALSYRSAGGITAVPVPLGARGTALIVFRRPTMAAAVTVPPAREREVATAGGRWSVAFEPGRGAPPAITLARLAGLDTQADPGVRHFSGVASYAGHVTLPRPRGGERLWLDLGRVGDIAEVRLNGVPVGTAWHAPYRLDVTGAARGGDNRIEVRVADLWANRLIGDAQPGATRIGFTVAPTYRADAPLRSAGLIGPVRVLATTTPPAK